MDINTTPLIDVMLVLLIMFIVTIPIQLHSVKLDMPRSAPAAAHDDPEVVTIYIDEQDAIHWNGADVISLEVAAERFAGLQQAQPQPELHVRAHAQARYETVALLLARAQKSGMQKLGIVDAQAFQ